MDGTAEFSLHVGRPVSCLLSFTGVDNFTEGVVHLKHIHSEIYYSCTPIEHLLAEAISKR